jgi:hypothetical protein
MTQPIDLYPQPQAQPNVGPSWSGLAPADLAGVNHEGPGVYTPSQNALASYMPMRVLARNGLHAWIVPVLIPAGVTSHAIQFDYAQLGIAPGVRSIAFRGQLPAGATVSYSDVLNAACLLAANHSAAPLNVVGTLPVLSFRDQFQATITLSAALATPSTIVLYEEEQLPILNY